MALSWQSLSIPDLKNMTTTTGGGSFAGLVSSGVAALQSQSLYGERLDWENDDCFTISDNQTITISAVHKGSVTGYMSEPLSLNGGAKWNDINNNTFTSLAFKLIDTFDENQQLGIGAALGAGGQSYNQPWASRKFWKGSEPFSLTLKFNLITIDNAKENVYDKAIRLLSFCYPRDLGEDQNAVKNLIDSIKKPDGTSLLNTSGENTIGKDNVVTAFTKAFRSWAIPGPSIYFDSSKSEEGNAGQGDNVSVVIGNLFAFGQCYVTNVGLEFSPTLDSTGYPLWCKCSISFQTAESNYCDSNGNLNLVKMNDSASQLGNLMSSIGHTASELISDFMTHLQKLFNAVIH